MNRSGCSWGKQFTEGSVENQPVFALCLQCYLESRDALQALRGGRSCLLKCRFSPEKAASFVSLCVPHRAHPAASYRGSSRRGGRAGCALHVRGAWGGRRGRAWGPAAPWAAPAAAGRLLPGARRAPRDRVPCGTAAGGTGPARAALQSAVAARSGAPPTRQGAPRRRTAAAAPPRLPGWDFLRGGFISMVSRCGCLRARPPTPRRGARGAAHARGAAVP